MSKCYPTRKNLITGRIQKSLCEGCINHLKIEFIKIAPFMRDDLMDADKEIKKSKVFKYNQGCKYLNIGRSNNHDKYCIVIIKCSQFKNKIMKKIKRDPAGHGNNAISNITGRPNLELNKDGGNSCSNPNWGTGNKGDANTDTQKERTEIQKYEDNLVKSN
jgi:hypothetical protein